MSACDMKDSIKRQELTSEEITETIIERIEKINPKINAYCTPTFDLARDMAKKADDEVKRGEKLGLLHGIPTSIKDVLITKGIRTTFGTKIHENNVPKEDEIAVKKLKESGIVLLGKTNTPTYGYWLLTKNKIFGETLNPWDLNRNSGGSSGGGAAQIASGLGPLAMCDDGGGSIRVPSCFCGVFGIKPSFGRIPRYPLHDITFTSLASIGPIVRYVKDAALMLDALAGAEDADKYSIPKPKNSYLDTIKEKPNKLKIGYSLDLGFVKAIDPEIEKTVLNAIQKFESIDWSVNEAKIKIRKAYITFATITTSGFAYDFNLKKHADLLEDDLIKMIEAGLGYSIRDLKRAEFQREKIYENIYNHFKEYDILITLTTVVPALKCGIRFPPTIDGKAVSPDAWFSNCHPFNLTGHPAASIPCGWTNNGLPIGMQIIGKKWDDATVLQVSKAFEEIAPWQDKKPNFN